ncbi:MAG: pilus assembly protein PilP [Nitrospirota bacterium]|nr:pilus assembly protein PilP [Nitrospirota bacterium]
MFENHANKIRRSAWIKGIGFLLVTCGLWIHGPALAQGVPGQGTPASAPGIASIDPDDEQIGAPEPYVYSARGLRDPFTLPPQASPEAGKKSILELTPLSDFQLLGIVWTQKGPYARVATQDGTGYTVRRGTRIGQSGGVIRKITRDRVIVEEWDTNVFGEKVRVETVLALRPEEVNP